MSLATLALSQPRTLAPQSAVSALAPSDARAAKARATLTGIKTATAARAEQPSPVEDQTRKQRLARKDQARQQVQVLVERIRTLKQFASDNPQVMAKQLAQIVKQLKSALKAYAEAGGTPPPGAGASTGMTAPSRTTKAEAKADPDADPAVSEGSDADAVETEAPTEPAVRPDAEQTAEAWTALRAEVRPADIYKDMKHRLSGSEAAADMTFVKEVRGIGKWIKELLDKAKVQMAFKPMDDETNTAFEDADEGLKAIDKALDDLDRGIRASSPEAGLFAALYA
ncbi:hypothetical protein KOAAANKH_00568 [Brevundimonas sp. NIBR10]|uniref:hypothetical protein n=1 Tax=Brevundimonas sp. NIBR10 TaxID=3015997 RepID=UPI0022F1BFEF|nr:hypothetical protein [Brevundimonas sp. NIBR10]WGM45704.1 hypothetical protein KOAAANKH_00568 [Brevundimonas sp. NIBR10]